VDGKFCRCLIDEGSRRSRLAERRPANCNRIGFRQSQRVRPAQNSRRERGLYLRRSEREGEAGPFSHEGAENVAIERGFVGVQVSEDGIRPPVRPGKQETSASAALGTSSGAARVRRVEPQVLTHKAHSGYESARFRAVFSGPP